MLQRLLTVALCLAALLPAQNTSCTLSGTVHDPGGSVIAATKVTLTGEGNGFVRTVTTTNDGFFAFPDLTPATFTLSIDAPGFKAYRQTGIAVGSGEQRSLGQIKLQVGQVSETINVTAEVVTVNLTSGEQGGTLSGDQLDQIALRGRDLFDAISLLPGVVDTGDGRDAPGPTSIGNIFIMGGRNDAKNMTVDGVSNLDTGSNGSVHSMPSIDSIAEVKVLMSAYGAENGRNPASISVITRGGGRDFHGQAAFYLKNEGLNANDFFANLAGKPRTQYRYNIATYSIGGPVILPKLLHRQQKLFFFFNQEFQQQVAQYGVKMVTVPSALERAGDFTQSKNTNSAVIQIRDPLNNKTAFPGNKIPANRLTTVGQSILNMFPLPNYVDPRPFQSNFYSAESGKYPRRTETARVDYSPKDNWQLYVSVSNNADQQHTPYGIWVDGSLNFPLTPIVFEQPGRLATVHSTNTITPSTFNEFTVAASQNTLRFYPEDPSKVDRTKLGILIPQRNAALNPLNMIPNMTFGGITNAANPSLNDGTPYFNQNTIYHFADNVSKVWDTHTFKFGVYHERTIKYQSASSATRGTISFGTDANNILDANDAYANALLGNYDTYAEATARPQGKYFFTNLEFFAQDDWKIKRNLSLSYGVRLYHDPPQYDVRNQLASFSLASFKQADAPVLLRPATVNGTKVAQNPITGATYPQGLIGAFAPGIGNPAEGAVVGGINGVPRGFYEVAPLAAAPRFGFAWDPFNKGRTSLRGGGGVYFDRIEGNPVMGQIGNPPTIFTPTQYYGTFADIQATVNAGLLAPNGSVTSLSTKGHQQTIYNFSLSIDQQVGRAELVTVGYTGSLGRHLLWERNLNPVPLGSTTAINGALLHPENRDPTASATTALPVNFMRPMQGLGDVLLYEFATASNYHALLTSFRHRFTHGLNASASYTFSKALDTVDSYSTQVDAFVNPRTRNYGPAGFDRSHVFSANFFWKIPKPGAGLRFRPAHWVADNWTLSGVTRMMTGGKFTPTYSLINGLPTPTGSSSETARVQVLNPDDPITTRFGPAPQPTAANPSPQIGNLGKNTFTGQGVNNWDLSIYKDLRFREGRVTGQLRFETYNTFNHSQFSTVDQALKFDAKGGYANPSFDLPTVARPPRRVQLAMRLTF